MSEPRTPGFFEPRSLVFWAFVGLVALGLYWRTSNMFELWGDYPAGIAASVIVWLVYGLVVGWLIYRRQLIEYRPVSSTIAAIAWGLFVAGGVVALVGQDLQSLTDKLFGFDASREWGPALRAPVLEESMKYLGVVALALIPRVRMNRVLDGVYYGMLSGLGFLVSENIFFSNEEIAFDAGNGIASHILDVMVLRGIFALPFSHVVYTAIAGAGIGYLVSRRGRPIARRIAVAAGFYITACLLHGFQNSPILDDVGGNLFIKGLPALVIFVIVVRWGRAEYRRDLAAIADELETITADEFAGLATRRRRRKAVKQADDGAMVQRVQRGQIDLLIAADIYGTESEETAEASSTLTVPDQEAG